MHLTNNDTTTFTGATISDILLQNNTMDTANNYNDVESRNLHDMVSHAMQLFRCSEESESPEESKTPITQATVVNAVVTVFKEIRFSRASMQDLNNLHKEAKSVVDILFGIFMVLLVQIILKFDMSSMLAPLLTISFGLSFAFAQVLSNLFLSMSFVMFLLPFNVGNRV
jgi:hypothetical protein